MSPAAESKRLIGLLPSVMIKPVRPSPFKSSAWNSGPACAIATKVLLPIASTMALNLLLSISDNYFSLPISRLVTFYSCSKLMVYFLI
jgi:hypothetical protein